jgi:hypothetical protein
MRDALGLKPRHSIGAPKTTWFHIHNHIQCEIAIGDRIKQGDGVREIFPDSWLLKFMIKTSYLAVSLSFAVKWLQQGL